MSATAVTAVDAESEETIVLAPLTAYDRCDHCGAQAYVVWVKEEKDLMFCHHHNNRYADKMWETGFQILLDERSKLVQDRLQGSGN